MFDCILIANRGEIACRIIRTARRLGIKTVAVYSDADAGALHVSLADEAFRIGPAPAAESYLASDRIMVAAALGGAQAIHPGYGFLSENADFAEACAAAGFVFIGPPADAIRAMGAKSRAKAIMEAAGVPVVPGYHGAAQDDASLIEAARAIGFPVLIKAVAGGGGKGMRIVEAEAELREALAAARREARAAFGDKALIVERYLDRPRHVEVQVFADAHGNAVHLFERDCSLQRRHQKVIEEAPAPDIGPALRRRLGEAAVAAARAIAYRGAGTIEFLLVGEPGGAAFYFMEMNTRLQVEHPVTEMITGLDLVEWQLRVAAGEPLPLSQADIAASGHAFEARIYAENPARDFLPATGTLSHVRFPEETVHVRTDTGVRTGDAIGIHYDPLIAKLIVWDEDRASALRRLRRALASVQIAGPATNVAFLLAVAGHPAFAQGDVDTGFIPRHRHDLIAAPGPVPPRLLAFACLDVLLRREEEAREAARRSADPYSPWHRTDGWRLNEDNHHVLAFRDGEALVQVTVHYRRDGLLLEVPGAAGPVRARGERDGGGRPPRRHRRGAQQATVIRAGDTVTVISAGRSHSLIIDDPAARAELREPQASTLRAPMPGRLAAVHVAPGERVTRGMTLVVLEAMKMEHAITAPADGVIAAVPFAVGDQVDDGADLVVFEDEARKPRGSLADVRRLSALVAFMKRRGRARERDDGAAGRHVESRLDGGRPRLRNVHVRIAGDDIPRAERSQRRHELLNLRKRCDDARRKACEIMCLECGQARRDEQAFQQLLRRLLAVEGGRADNWGLGVQGSSRRCQIVIGPDEPPPCLLPLDGILVRLIRVHRRPCPRSAVYARTSRLRCHVGLACSTGRP